MTEHQKSPKINYKYKALQKKFFDTHCSLCFKENGKNSYFFQIPVLCRRFFFLVSTIIITIAVTMTWNYISTKKDALELENFRSKSWA